MPSTDDGCNNAVNYMTLAMGLIGKSNMQVGTLTRVPFREQRATLGSIAELCIPMWLLPPLRARGYIRAHVVIHMTLIPCLT